MSNRRLHFEAGSALDAGRLAAALALGVCVAVREKAITPRYACEKLFRPSLEQTLRRLGVDSSLCDSVAEALELEDVSNLAPSALDRLVDGLVVALTGYLETAPEAALTERESWLHADEPRQLLAEGTGPGGALVIPLRTTNGVLSLREVEGPWWRLVLTLGMNEYVLGCENIETIAPRLQEGLEPLLAAKTTASFAGIQAAPLLTLSEEGCSVFAGDSGESRILYFQDAHGVLIGSLGLSPAERQEWFERLEGHRDW